MISKLAFLIGLIFLSSALVGEDSPSLKVRPYFVQVKITIAKDDTPFMSEQKYDIFEHYYLENKAFITYGVIVDSRTVVIENVALRPSRFKAIAVKTSDGKEFSASLSAVCKGRNLYSLKVDGELVAPNFKGIDLTQKIPLISIGVNFRNDNVPYLLQKEVTNRTKVIPLFESEKNIYPAMDPESINGQFGIIVNKKGSALCLRSSEFYQINGKSSFFVPNELKWLTLKEMDEAKASIVSQIHQTIFFVHIHFRKGNKNEDYYSEKPDELKLLGVLYNKEGDVLLPYDLSYEEIKKIEKIEIELPDQILLATFKGSFANFGGILISSEMVKGREHPLNLNYVVKPEEILYEFGVMWSSAEDYQVDFKTTRIEYKMSSVDDRPVYEISAYGKPNNCLIFNAEMQIPGILSIYKNQDYIVDENSWSSKDRYYLAFADLEKEISSPESNFDKRSVLMNKQESLTPVWLGVDVQELSQSLSEHFRVLDKTKNGSIGVLVTNVYKNSPAEKMKIQNLDVLLSVQYLDSDRVYEFKTESNGYYSDYSFNDEANYGNGYNYPFFSNRKNLVTTVLSKLEIGKKVKLKILRQGEFKNLEFVLEKAPNDFSNADKYVDEELGFQVKEITYEVMAALSKSSEQTGVMISTLSEGKPAALARLNYFEIITHIDGEKVSGLKDFERLLTSKKEKQTEYTFTVSYLGQNRLVKVDIKK